MAWKPDYVSLASMKSQLGITDTDDDTLLQTMITTASRAVDTETRRQFGKTAGAEDREYRVEWRDDRSAWVAVIDDLMSTTGLVVENEDADAITDYRLEPRNAAADGVPWERLVIAGDAAVRPTGDGWLTITANPWGWTAMPAAAEAATRLQVSRFFARRESPYGVAGSPDLGSEIRLLAKLDPDVAVMLSGLVRTGRPA